MQAFQALTASHQFLLAANSGHDRIRSEVDERSVADRPACHLQMRTAELGDAVRNHRGACMRVFATRRIAPALARLGKAFATMLWRRVRGEDAIASLYEGRSWCDATEREINNDIANWRCTRF